MDELQLKLQYVQVGLKVHLQLIHVSLLEVLQVMVELVTLLNLMNVMLTHNSNASYGTLTKQTHIKCWAVTVNGVRRIETWVDVCITVSMLLLDISQH